MKKITNFFKIALPLFFLALATVLVFCKEYQQASYFLIFYCLLILEDSLKEIKYSINCLWYSIYLKNKGMENEKD